LWPLSAGAEQASVDLQEAGLVALGSDLAKDGGVHGGDNVAESGLTVVRLIDRKRLVPIRGSGWQPA
jgi:hypothetical protein